MSSQSELFSDIYKVVIIGASNVGKTALVYRYVINDLPPGLTSTVGVEFTKRVVLQKSSGNRIQLHIWDTAGQEKFKSVTKHYYRGTDICLLTFDLTDNQTFTDVDHWVKEINDYTPEGCVVALLGNKADLSDRVVSRDIALQYAIDHGYIYFETSALWSRDACMMKDEVTGGIESIFDIIINRIYKNHSKKEELVVFKDKDNVKKKDCEC